eukprot:1157161-Pelagomonas_calceolata.AAC.20
MKSVKRRSKRDGRRKEVSIQTQRLIAATGEQHHHWWWTINMQGNTERTWDDPVEGGALEVQGLARPAYALLACMGTAHGCGCGWVEVTNPVKSSS